MPLLKPETKRFYAVLYRLVPVAIRYRSDRNEIKKAEGKILYPEKYQKHAASALKAFIDLGPAFIKLGQLLSVRPDVLPQPYIDEFSKLQDEVPPAPFNEVKQVIEKDLGPIDQVFNSFRPEAVTGASLGQVYRATYHGEEVVVKVNRPGIKERIAIDTKVLKRLVPLVGRFIDPGLRFSAQSVVDQFSDTIDEEVDYRVEAANLREIKNNLKSDKTVIIPEIFQEVSGEHVLVLQYIGGIKVSDVNALEAAGLDRSKLARRVARLFFKMLLSQEIFHADPHPGNISIADDGKIILYDFGMAERLDRETRLKLVKFYVALVDSDSAKIVDIMVDLGILQPLTNRYVIRAGVDLAIADMRGRKVEETEVKALMEIANRTIYQFPFKLPRNLVLYMRMLSILEGVCLTLDPKFRFIKILGGLLEQEGLVREAYVAELRETLDKIGDALDAAVETAPLLKKYLENQQMEGQQGSYYGPRRGRQSSRGGFVSGAMAGVGAAGVTASLFFLGSAEGKVGLGISLFLLVAAVVAGSRS
ncbi:MAG TPA: AarF/ABC1/UbiB kinase family protein [Nitrososphaerales archaeon]|nr:AarF/ABC1/UbiB kinase family protein [Nitrososphaerales archaeon]